MSGFFSKIIISGRDVYSRLESSVPILKFLFPENRIKD